MAINIRIYFETSGEWQSIAAMHLIGHMTSLKLYDSPDSSVDVVQKYPSACPPVSYSIVPTCDDGIFVRQAKPLTARQSNRLPASR